MKTIRTQIMIHFSVIILIFIILLISAVTFSIKKNVVPLSMSMNYAASEAKANEIGELIKGYSREVQTLAEESIFKSGNIDRIKAELVRRNGLFNSDFRQILYADSKGYNYTSLGTSVDIRDRPHYQAIFSAKKSLYISAPLISRNSGDKSFVITSAVTRGKRLTGLVGASIKLNTLSGFATSFSMGQKGYGWIVDGSGIVVAHPDSRYVFNMNIFNSSESGFRNLGSQAAGIMTGEVTIARIINPEGTREYLFIHSIPNTSNWFFILSIPENEIDATMTGVLYSIYFSFFILVILMTVGTYFISEKITGPIVELDKLMTEVELGNLDVQSKYSSPDEIGRISGAFNKMTVSLKTAMDKINLSNDELTKRNSEIQKLYSDLAVSEENLRENYMIVRQKQQDLEKTLSDLEESRSFTIQAVDSSRELFGWLTTGGVLQYANSTSLSMIGKTADQILGKLIWETPWFDHNPGEQAKVRSAVSDAAKGVTVKYDAFLKNAEGFIREIDFCLRPTFDSSGRITMLVAEGIDVTDERNAVRQKEKLSQQFHHSQKMEAIGQLAGGIAHDFNNSLGAIIGAAELLNFKDNGNETHAQYINMIITAAERAGELTRKLLAFSRKGNKISSAIDAASVVHDTAELLKRTIDKKIIVTVDNRAASTVIIGDDTLLQNAFMNMGINASHAMPDGGTLEFILENIQLDKNYCSVSQFEIEPGIFIDISIRDNGHGMSQDVMSHIFEPFFTTKEPGKGTGLGLAAVYGTIQEHHGAITVYSEEGMGTVFHVYLPVSAESVYVNNHEEEAPTGSGTILLVDDEEVIRITASVMLGDLGYSVICAENGELGVKTFADKKGEIDLVIMDMIMPVMGGRKAFIRIREIDPEVPVIISSGFTKEDDLLIMKDHGISGFLYKPFRRIDLADMVAKTIRKRLPGS